MYNYIQFIRYSAVYPKFYKNRDFYFIVGVISSFIDAK